MCYIMVNILMITIGCIQAAAVSILRKLCRESYSKVIS